MREYSKSEILRRIREKRGDETSTKREKNVASRESLADKRVLRRSEIHSSSFRSDSNTESISFIQESFVKRKKFIRARIRNALKTKPPETTKSAKSFRRLQHPIASRMGISTLASPFVSKDTQYEYTSDKYRKKLYPIVNAITSLEETYNQYTNFDLKEEVSARSYDWKEELRPIFKEISEYKKKFELYPEHTLNSKESLQRKKEQKELNKLKKKLERKFDAILPEAFAMIRESAERSSVNQFPDENQLFVGLAVHKGYIAEFPTGEGKTLSGVLPACLNALCGQVHMVTVNDYLARYQGQFYGPVYESLGLQVGLITDGGESFLYNPKYINPKSHSDSSWKHWEPQSKQEVYKKTDVMYGKAEEFVFDFLHDHTISLSEEENCQQGLHFAIIDEPDSVLIDEARMPCRLSGSDENEGIEKRKKTAQIVKSGKLKEDVDFKVNKEKKIITLTDEGQKKAEALVGVKSFYGNNEENQIWGKCVKQALYVKYLMKKEKDFFIQGNEIIIINEEKGRPMPGVRWNNGIHQALEAAYNLPIRSEGITLASSTMANYFKRYTKKGGMTGTALVDAELFKKIYGLDVVKAPHAPVQRKDYKDVYCIDENEKLELAVDEIVKYYKIGRPVLVGTLEINDTVTFSKSLKRRGIPHQVLNAKYLDQEARIIEKAGEMGKVTIATNMAGRGTDIENQVCDPKILLNHWKKQGIAPTGLSYDDPQRKEKLLKHWAKIFLKKKSNEVESMSIENLELELEIYWAERNMKPIPIDSENIKTVNDLGGLHVVGTEKHESKRIDIQLKGRAGRRGSFGSSRSFVSIRDNKLLNKFGVRRHLREKETRSMMLQTRDAMKFQFQPRGWEDKPELKYPKNLERAMSKHKKGQPVRSSAAKKYFDRIQKNASESNNKLVEWTVREDKVLNLARNTLHRERQKIMRNESNKELILGMLEERLDELLPIFIPDNIPQKKWGLLELHHAIRKTFNIYIPVPAFNGKKSYEGVRKKILSEFAAYYERREQKMGAERMRRTEKHVLLHSVGRVFDHYQDSIDGVMGNTRASLIGNSDGNPIEKYFRRLNKRNHQIHTEMRSELQNEVARSIFMTCV